MNKTYWFSLIFAATALIVLSITIANQFITIPSTDPITPTPRSSPEDETSNKQGKSTAINTTTSTIQTHTIILKVQKGDNLLHILKRAGINNNDAFAVIEVLKGTYNPSKLSINQEITITSSVEGEHSQKHILHEMQLDASPTDTIIVRRQLDDSFSVEKKHTPLTRRIFKSYANINSSLFEAGKEAGLSANHIMKLINLYSYDIDFQRDIKKGDKIEVLYENLYKSNGTKVKDGDILYASLTVNNTPLPIYLYENEFGDPEYYTKEGHTVRKSLLRTPVNGARLSSGYGMRKHPVLGYSKLHKGIDFAAPIGTPIYAAGSGKIVEIGRKGSFGNYIKIKHNDVYSTAYAHLHRFARGMKRNKRVKQGEVIGYVGKTGRVTGAHLHYEIHKYNKATNPKYVRFQPKKTMKKERLNEFTSYQLSLHNLLQNTPDNKNLAVALEKH